MIDWTLVIRTSIRAIPTTLAIVVVVMGIMNINSCENEKNEARWKFDAACIAMGGTPADIRNESFRRCVKYIDVHTKPSGVTS